MFAIAYVASVDPEGWWSRPPPLPRKIKTNLIYRENMSKKDIGDLPPTEHKIIRGNLSTGKIFGIRTCKIYKYFLDMLYVHICEDFKFKLFLAN